MSWNQLFRFTIRTRTFNRTWFLNEIKKNWDPWTGIHHHPKNSSTVLNYLETDFVCWSRILYVRKLVAGGYLLTDDFLVISNSKSFYIFCWLPWFNEIKLWRKAIRKINQVIFKKRSPKKCSNKATSTQNFIFFPSIFKVISYVMKAYLRLKYLFSKIWKLETHYNSKAVKQEKPYASIARTSEGMPLWPWFGKQDVPGISRT